MNDQPWIPVNSTTVEGVQLYRRIAHFAGDCEDEGIIVHYDEAIGASKTQIGTRKHYRLGVCLFHAWMEGLTGISPAQGFANVVSQPDPQAYADAAEAEAMALQGSQG